MVYFWACEVSETKAAVVKVPEGFVLNVCNATLSSFSNDASSAVSVGLEAAQMDNKAWKGVVAHLGAAAHAHQVKLDLVFGFAPQVKFYVAKGAGKVNLTGYFQPGPPADLFDNDGSATIASDEKLATSSSSKKHNKKRARDEKVTWDQASSSDSEEEPKPKTKVPPVKTAVSTSAPQQKKTAPSAAPVASSSTNAGASSEGSSKKKNRKKNKKSSSDKKD